MPLTPKAVYEDLRNKDLDHTSAIEILTTLIENTDNIDTRLESLNILDKIQAKGGRIFKLLENLLISDSHKDIRNMAALLLKKFFIERALKPMKWAFDHEKELECLITIISTLSEINNMESKSILVNKLYYLYNQENKYNLIYLDKSKAIESLKKHEIAELLINYYFIFSLKKRFGFIKYEFNNSGYITKLDLTNVDTQGIFLSDFLELIYSLKQLEALDLRFNNLIKLSEITNESSSLKSLDLSYNKLLSIPKSIVKIRSLKKLNLKSNRLRSLPNSIKNFSGLETLILRNNILTQIPSSIKSLKNLRILDLHGNKLDSFNFILNVSIRELELGWNNFKELPKEIKSLTLLKKLGLSGNKLVSLPKWISVFQSLKSLDLYDNEIYELPNSIGFLKSLEKLVLRNNHLTILPDSMKNLENLKILNLSWNNFFSLPEWIGELSSLEEINLWGNKLESLPESICSLSNLKLLDLSFNRFNQFPIILRNLERKNDLIIKL
ncbi:MAG: leucine-rich repeat domain-containing protein [Promethearchaeota archaeon]